MVGETRVIGRDERIREYLLPQRVVLEENAERTDALFQECTLQIMLFEENCAVLKEGGALILDYGREIHGGVRLLIARCVSGGSLRLRFGESVSECCAETTGKNYEQLKASDRATATNDHSPRDFCVPCVPLSDTEWGSTGFRFLRIDNVGLGDIEFKSVPAVFVHRDLQPDGRFECDDARLNEIYQTAAYTLMLNMQHHLWDGIKRDRLVWIGDLHPETKGILSLFGSHSCVPEALRLMAETTPLPGFMNAMPAYSMWFIIILADYYLQNGNREELEGFGEYLGSLTRMFCGLVDESGELNLSGYFLDWPSYEKEGARAGVYALFEIAMRRADFLLGELGRSQPEIGRTLARLNRNLPDGGLKQVIALRALAGHDDGRAAERLAEGGAQGFSTFMSYYIARAMFEGGRRREALDCIKTFYGGMLDRGATTFWEDFDMGWLEGSSRIDELPKPGERDLHGDYGAYCYVGFRHSLCHGWSCGPVQFFTEYILGVRVREPGCRVVEIAPYLGDLEHVSGAYPTPLGLIRIVHTRTEGKIRTEYSAPEGIRVILRPAAE